MLETAAKAGSKSAAARLAELEALPPPECLYLWEWFQQLNARRPSGGSGVSAITWEGIDAWARLKRITPLPYELDIIEALDGVFMRHVAEELRRRFPPKPNK